MIGLKDLKDPVDTKNFEQTTWPDLLILDSDSDLLLWYDLAPGSDGGSNQLRSS